MRIFTMRGNYWEDTKINQASELIYISSALKPIEYISEVQLFDKNLDFPVKIKSTIQRHSELLIEKKRNGGVKHCGALGFLPSNLSISHFTL